MKIYGLKQQIKSNSYIYDEKYIKTKLNSNNYIP